MQDLLSKLENTDIIVILMVIAAVVVFELVLFFIIKMIIKKSKTKSITVRLDKSTYNRVKQYAYNRGLSISDFTKGFLENFAKEDK